MQRQYRCRGVTVPQSSASAGKQVRCEMAFAAGGGPEVHFRDESVTNLSKVLKIVAGAVGAVVALVVILLFLIPVINPPPKTYRFVFPAGTQRTRDMTDSGFALRTMVPGAPPLPREEGFRVVRFDVSPMIETSEEYVFGQEYFREEHYIVSASGKRQKFDGIGCICIPSVEHVPAQVTCNVR